MLISVIKIGKERLCNLFGIGSYLGICIQWDFMSDFQTLCKRLSIETWYVLYLAKNRS